MMGIDVDALNKIIKVIDLDLTSLNDNINKIIDSTNSLTDCISGNDLDFIRQELTAQTKKLKLIYNVSNNYQEILKNVKKSYEAQDKAFTEMINHANPIN